MKARVNIAPIIIMAVLYAIVVWTSWYGQQEIIASGHALGGGLCDRDLAANSAVHSRTLISIIVVCPIICAAFIFVQRRFPFARRPWVRVPLLVLSTLAVVAISGHIGNSACL